MSGWATLSVCAPIGMLGLGLCGLLLTIKVSKTLRNIFVFSDLPMKTAQFLENPSVSFRSVAKRLFPLYGICAYRSIQYELPPAAHAYLFLWFLSILWSASMAASLEGEGFTLPGALIVAVSVSIISVVFCKWLNSVFIRSFNKVQEEPVHCIKTTIESKAKTEKTWKKGQSLEVLIIASVLATSIISLWSCFSMAVQEDALVEGGFYIFLVGLVADVPIRLLLCWVYKRCKMIPVYELQYLPRSFEIGPVEFPKYNKTPRDQELNYFDQASYMRDQIFVRIEQEHEFTIASHNEVSFEEMSGDFDGFYCVPQAMAFESVLNLSPSPKKYTSPLKRKVVPEESLANRENCIPEFPLFKVGVLETQLSAGVDPFIRDNMCNTESNREDNFIAGNDEKSIFHENYLERNSQRHRVFEENRQNMEDSSNIDFVDIRDPRGNHTFNKNSKRFMFKSEEESKSSIIRDFPVVGKNNKRSNDRISDYLKEDACVDHILEEINNKEQVVEEADDSELVLAEFCDKEDKFYDKEDKLDQFYDKEDKLDQFYDKEDKLDQFYDKEDKLDQFYDKEDKQEKIYGEEQRLEEIYNTDKILKEMCETLEDDKEQILGEIYDKSQIFNERNIHPRQQSKERELNTNPTSKKPEDENDIEIAENLQNNKQKKQDTKKPILSHMNKGKVPPKNQNIDEKLFRSPKQTEQRRKPGRLGAEVSSILNSKPRMNDTTQPPKQKPSKKPNDENSVQSSDPPFRSRTSFNKKRETELDKSTGEIHETNKKTETNRSAFRKTERKTGDRQSSYEQPAKKAPEALSAPYLSKQAKFTLLKGNLAQKTQKKDNRHFDAYNQDLMSDFHDKLTFQEDAVKLDDREFVKSQKKKMATISAAYGNVKLSDKRTTKSSTRGIKQHH